MATDDQDDKTKNAGAAAGAAGAAGAGDGGDPPDPDEAALGDAGKRALQRERDRRKQLEQELAAVKPKAEQFDQLTEKQRKEQQTAEQRMAELESELGAAKLGQAKLQAALDAGLPHTMAARLVGANAAELKEDAEALRAQLGTSGTRRVTGDAGAGTDDQGAGAPNMDSAIRRMAGRAG